MKGFIFISALFLSSAVLADEQNLQASAGDTVGQSMNSSGVQDIDKPLNVNGQTRNLQMMMTLKNDKDQIQFFDVRRNYEQEVPTTNY